MSGVDLNELRNRVLSTQQQGVDFPSNPDRNVYVDDEGNIVLNPRSAPGRTLSSVPQKTFAVSLVRDRQTVAQKMPANTQEMSVSGTTGWIYHITTELGDPYTLFAFHDGSAYQVMVVFPEVAGRYGAHDAHLFGNGCICFGDALQGGLPTLEQAYAKSVLWANGFSVFLRTGQFPFSRNNL